MTGSINIPDDATLQQLLTLLTIMPDTVEIHDRVFCEVPQVDYADKLDPDIGDGRKLMSSVYKAYYEDSETVWVLVGEDDGYGEDASGSRNLVNNPVTKEEFVAWVGKYGVEAFHIDFPKPESVENLQ